MLDSTVLLLEREVVWLVDVDEASTVLVELDVIATVLKPLVEEDVGKVADEVEVLTALVVA